MTRNEAAEFIQGKINCMEKCDVFERWDESHYKNDCDECEYNYSQGNFGEQLKAFKCAVEVLKGSD